MAESLSGLGTGGSQRGRGRRVVKYPFPDTNSLDDVLEALRDIILKHEGKVSSIKLAVGRPIEVELLETRPAGDAEALEEPPILLEDIVRKVPLQTITGVYSSPEELLAKIVQRAGKEQAVASFIVAGDRYSLCRWFSRGQDEDLRQIMGMTVHAAPGALPGDTAVVCLTPSKLASPLDVFKGFMFHLDNFKPKEVQV